MSNLYSLDGRVPVGQAIPFGLQHVLAMFVSNVTPIIILANVVGLDVQTSAALVQNCMVIAGIGTLVQLYPLWRVGSRLPVVMGISFTFLSLSIAIATTQGMGALMGAVIVGGLVEGLLGLCAKYWLRLISPVVAATVVTAIGVSLLPIGANSFAGGQGAADFGSVNNWIVGSLLVGYILALCMGMVDFSGLHNVGVISLPKFMPFKPEFHLGTILSVIAIYLVSATETIGDTTALCSSAVGRDVKPQELQGSVACDGFVSTVAGLFGCTPITSFSQNVGLAAMSGVVNRFTIATGAVIMILGGIFPAVGFVLTTIPQAVLGGCTIMMFGSILFAGINMVARCGNNQRNLVIVATSLSIGLGFTASSEMFHIFPELVRTVFADNCVAVIFLLALVLNLVLPKEKEGESQK